MILGILETSHSVRASGEGMYTEGDYSLIGQTQGDIIGDDEVEEIYEEKARDEYEYEDNETDDNSETPLYRQSRNKELSWYQQLFENALIRFIGIRV